MIMPEGFLYLVATPIGNLEDITCRALRILREVDLILVEDTRRFRKLMAHYGFAKPLLSYFQPREEERIPHILTRLQKGMCLALVSDAGTPVLSDPGFKLVKAVIEEGFRVIPVPGPSAITAALIASGLPTHAFSFWGFLPRRSGERKRFLQELSSLDGTLVFFESPARLLGTIRDMLDVWGDRRFVVAREITKLHEEFMRGTLSSLLEVLKGRILKGELVLLVEGGVEAGKAVIGGDRLSMLLEAGFSQRDVAKIVRILYGLSKREVYSALKDMGG